MSGARQFGLALAGMVLVTIAAYAQVAPTPRVDVPASTSAPVPPPDLAFAAFQRGYYVTALREALVRLDGNANDAAAMTLIGQLYHDGLGVKRDLVTAAHWYRLGSDHGNREATFALGLMQLQGDGVAVDRKSAGELFEKAAALGHAGALYNLAVMAMEAPTPDFARTKMLFDKAAELGDPDAMYGLAILYREGRGVAADPVLSTQWLSRAAWLDHLPGMVDYAIALYNGTGIARNETTAARLFLKAANRNNPVAQNRLARLLATGHGMPKDIVEAMKWHLLARAANLKDEWLDSQLLTLTPTQQTAVEAAVRAYVGK